MQKTMKLLGILLLCLCLAVPAYAATVSCEGGRDSSGNCRMEIDSDGMISYTGGGIKRKYEVKTTNDTLTAVESGTVYFMDPTQGSPIRITLPDADVGLTYTFVAIDGHASGLCYTELKPQSTDTFVGGTNGASTTTWIAGDKIYNSNSYTGDAITVTCGADTYWYVHDIRGTWADGNQP